jgi:hypothetical protein
VSTAPLFAYECRYGRMQPPTHDQVGLVVEAFRTLADATCAGVVGAGAPRDVGQRPHPCVPKLSTALMHAYPASADVH